MLFLVFWLQPCLSSLTFAAAGANFFKVIMEHLPVTVTLQLTPTTSIKRGKSVFPKATKFVFTLLFLN